MSNPALWMRMHGGVTHFPIALIVASLFFDIMAQIVKREPYERDLRAAAFYCLILAALGALAAVVTGLFASSWQAIGTGLLAKHHFFAWPGFALIVILAIWRLATHAKTPYRAYGLYLVLAAVTTVLMLGAGYWGGEMFLGSASSAPASSAMALPGSGAQQILPGQPLFAKSCSSCHGPGAQGAYGPNLRHLPIPDSQVAATIKNGKGSGMPAFGKQYSDKQILQVVAYLRSLK